MGRALVTPLPILNLSYRDAKPIILALVTKDILLGVSQHVNQLPDWIIEGVLYRIQSTPVVEFIRAD